MPCRAGRGLWSAAPRRSHVILSDGAKDPYPTVRDPSVRAERIRSGGGPRAAVVRRECPGGAPEISRWQAKRGHRIRQREKTMSRPGGAPEGLPLFDTNHTVVIVRSPSGALQMFLGMILNRWPRFACHRLISSAPPEPKAAPSRTSRARLVFNALRNSQVSTTPETPPPPAPCSRNSSPRSGSHAAACGSSSR